MGSKKRKKPLGSLSPARRGSPVALDALSPEDFDLEALEALGEDGVADESLEEPVGSTQRYRARRYGLVAMILLIASAVIVLLLGYVAQGEWPSWLGWVSLRRAPEIRLVDSRAGRILMVETNGDLDRVLVETSGQASWLLVSRDDTTATNPAFSPDVGYVAYISEQDGGQVAIVSLTDDTRFAITSTQVEIAALTADFSGVSLCPWTSVAWAPDGRRVAFFGCREILPLSLALIADVHDPRNIGLDTIPDSDVGIFSHRQIQWLDSTHVTISTPTDEGTDRVQTFTVP